MSPNGEVTVRDLQKAAQYVRMSTDMQRYSIDSQAAAIALYAATHGYSIVRSYNDAGKSGLTFEGRDALKALISDVTSGRADFQVILVYDVSRWGRFQNVDESAYYEFICRQAGIAVEYCAEEFQNDGSLMATIIKNIKRAMAGEYSRELSIRVHAGQRRLAAIGYHIGGTPGFGLRRFLLDEQGSRKMELKFGQQKSLHTEHTILVPGPIEELKIVREVYDLFLDAKETLNDIARTLNARGLLNSVGRVWRPENVRDLLTNEKYIGNSMYNRASKKLGARWRRNPPTEWVRKAGAWEPIVPVARFRLAQGQLKDNAVAYTENEMLDYLTATWCRYKKLSRATIDGSPTSPTGNTYIRHFGSMANTFSKVGYHSQTVITRERLSSLRKKVCQDIVLSVRQHGGVAEFLSGRVKCELKINNEIILAVVLGRWWRRHEKREWRFCYRTKRKPDILIVARIEGDSFEIRDYFILPFTFLPAGSWTSIQGREYPRLENFRSDSLAPFCRLCARQALAAPR